MRISWSCQVLANVCPRSMHKEESIDPIQHLAGIEMSGITVAAYAGNAGSGI